MKNSNQGKSIKVERLMPPENNSKQWGELGTTLVFLHYFGGSANSWRWVCECLMDAHRCISISLPGFGGSPALQSPSIKLYAEYVQEQLNLLGVNKYTLIAHSMGGKIAMQVAANASIGSIDQLILIAPSPPSTETISEEEKEKMLKTPDRKEAEITIAAITKQLLNGEQYALAVQNQLDLNHATRQWWVLEGVNESIVDNLKSIDLPITVLTSEDDPAITLDTVNDRVIAFFKQSKLVTTRNAGHLLPMEASNWVAEKIRSIIHAHANNRQTVEIKNEIDGKK